jgi:hypothetical protein
MKKENNITASTFGEAYQSIGASPMTEEDILQTDVLFENAFFKEKYRKGLKTLTLNDMSQLKKQHPNWQLTDILSAIIKDYNPELPPSILREMTQFIISEWENNHQEAPILC